MPTAELLLVIVKKFQVKEKWSTGPRPFDFSWMAVWIGFSEGVVEMF